MSAISQRGGLGNPLTHCKQRQPEGAGIDRHRAGSRGVAWATGLLLSRVLEVGVVGLEAELEERRACQKEISTRISGAYPLACECDSSSFVFR